MNLFVKGIDELHLYKVHKGKDRFICDNYILLLVFYLVPASRRKAFLLFIYEGLVAFAVKYHRRRMTLER